MASDARMIGVHVDGARAVSISLDKSWLGALQRDGFEARSPVDVGEPILSSVTILSAAEARAINAAFRAQVEEELGRQESAYREFCMWRLACADRIDRLLAEVGQVSYYSPWVIVEEADMD
jgi:hypothetical protein